MRCSFFFSEVGGGGLDSKIVFAADSSSSTLKFAGILSTEGIESFSWDVLVPSLCHVEARARLQPKKEAQREKNVLDEQPSTGRLVDGVW